MQVPEMTSVLRWLSKPFRKISGRRSKCRGDSTLNKEASDGKQDHDSQSGSSVRAHLLLRLVGGECYGSVASSECEMDSALWSRLPDELLPRVLLMLPFITKLRFRAVCKEWRSLLSSYDYRDDSITVLDQPATRPPLVCAYRLVHGNSLRDRGLHGTDVSAAVQSSQLRLKLKCREVQLLFPDIPPTDSRGHRCKIDAHISAQDGVLSVEIWKERRLLQGNSRRHRGAPTVLEHFPFLLNPITDTGISLPQLQTEGDHSLGRNLGLVTTKVEPSMHLASEGRFDIFSFYWTSWWLDLGMGLRQNTSWFARVRHYPAEVDTYPESVHVRDRSGERLNLIGIGISELVAGRFQAVISKGVVYGVHYPHAGCNRLFTRTLHAAEPEQWSQWHDEASVPQVSDATVVRFFLVEHSASHSVYYVGQSCHKGGKLTNRICSLQSDCSPSWFWLPISTMPEPLVDDMMTRSGVQRPKSPMLDAAFVAGDFIIMVFRNFGPRPQVCFVAFHVYKETWEYIFNDGPSEDLAEFDGFFEVRSNLRFPRDIREGLTL